MKKLLTLIAVVFALSSCALPSPSTPSTNPTTSSGPSITTSHDDTKVLFEINCGFGGSVMGTQNGMYEKGTHIELSAVAEEGFTFAGFYEDGNLIYKDNIYSFELLKTTILDARFVNSSDEEGYYYLNYSHIWKAEDISNTNGGTTKEINGLTWTYTSYTYKQNSTKGVQIGSSNRPQTTPLKFTANLPQGVVFTSFFVEVAVANGGSSTFEVNCGTTNLTRGFNLTDIETFTYDELDIESTSISFSFKSSAKALYIYSFGFGLKVPSDIDLSLGSDSDIVADPIVPGSNNIPNVNYNPISKEDYYKDINTSVTGTTLVKSLRTLISDMTSTSYEQAKYMLQYIDENPAKPGYLYGMYDGDNILAEWLAGSTWNREHVWPCAKMAFEDDFRPSASTRNHTSDLHNLRAACPTVNGYHSDKYYGNENVENYMYPNVVSGIPGKHEFTGDFRGDVARIMFYMYVRYDGLELSDNPSGPTTMGKLSLFIERNEKDPVDSFEQQRNDRIYAYQGNRNPFIDYPELVNKIFKNYR